MGFRRLVILTGAGISAESGLGTFRDKDGLWTRYNLEDVATPQGFARDPAFVHEFYNARRRGLREAQPHAAHQALARLEAAAPTGSVLLVTQNVDDLHERAGSRNLIHMHGELTKVRCDACETVAEHRDDLSTGSVCGHCGGAGFMRPHIVWFGEMPMMMDEIYAALDACDLFVSIGTSGTVYPAAGFVEHVRRRRRAHTVELNLDPSEGHSLFAERRYGAASAIVPEFVDRLLAEGI
ncbi:Sir2 family NAD+-dependent deacetylase [Zavarzinia compransoris]|uniref:NAD-dependent protein deacylase n=1 Tax=Zavarzinia compransoris TaxID=1264899 RepID=A0A317E4M1_9PROT|nr:Sir2 family NAD+-dependent deacetylase [Zavarzinia compransoris]PWR21939.1 NAD-dependent protein deacylase [Zavarzinia compransoris]TDP47324.1 NAD-dependent deacetylase [Zavarzinia compransoris]